MAELEINKIGRLGKSTRGKSNDGQELRPKRTAAISPTNTPDKGRDVEPGLEKAEDEEDREEAKERQTMGRFTEVLLHRAEGASLGGGWGEADIKLATDVECPPAITASIERTQQTG